MSFSDVKNPPYVNINPTLKDPNTSQSVVNSYNRKSLLAAA